MKELDVSEMELEPVAQNEHQGQPEAESQEVVEAKEVSQPRQEAEKNWVEARKVLQSQKAEIEALRVQLEEVKKASIIPEVDEFADLPPDEVITIAQAQKIAEKKAREAEKRAEEAARKIVEEHARNLAYGSQEQDARQKFDDYDYVVENFAVPMIQNNPALAAAIKASPNPFMTAYKIAKTSDEYEAQMSKQQTSPKAEKIMKNASRPNPGNSVTPSLKGHADQYAKLSQADIWKMSQEYARKA